MQSTMIPLNAQPDDGRVAGAVVVSMPEHPPDYIVWSVANIFYGNPCCLGLLAFYYSIKSRDRMLVGDTTGARLYGSKACITNGCTLALIIIQIILIIVFFVMVKYEVVAEVTEDTKTMNVLQELYYNMLYSPTVMASLQ
ncbi:interferon-induced transmembrane protein 1-like [Clarias gariepinus]|uniref:interferon-induced transmembrane protein 1-like n=1 Tax=Clarias gariepinus TaxID=13013 RepID=UPI00234DD5DE|nr:interferon-induced transmembrane protein 1-like [Clarias gariepinus]